MNTERLIELLKSCGADAWELTCDDADIWEFYFIRHALDQNRVRSTRHLGVRVYRRFEDGKYLGSAGGEIPPTATEAEASAAIGGVLSAAAVVRNPAYTLNAPAGEVLSDVGAAPDPAESAKAFMEVLRSLPETQTERVNSYEVFTGSHRVRYINSEGVDVTALRPSSMAEVVLNASRGAHEIEVYRKLTCGTCDKAALRKALEAALRTGRDRLAAVPTPALGTCDVLFSGTAAAELYGYFASRVNAAFKVRGYSDWETGKPLCESVRGDRVTLKALAFLPNSSRNTPFDAEGAPVRDALLIGDGTVRRFVGNRQFSCYLGLADSFQPGNYAVSGGSESAEALRTGTCLEAVDFSDFQADPVTGDIAGEIRLAYLREGGKVTPVTGGSVSGNMRDFIPSLRMSRELEQQDNLLLPALTRLSGVHIAGGAGA